MINVTINPNDLRRINSSFDKVIRNTDDWSAPLSECAELGAYFYKDNVDKQGFNLGARWQPLKTSTIRSRASKGYGPRPILIMKGDLMNSFKKGTVTKTSAIIENAVGYAQYHQEGTKYMPARKLMGFPTKLVKSFSIVFNNFLKSKLRMSWGR